jgi:poly(A) polymerase
MSESNPAISGFIDFVDPDALKVVRGLLEAGHEAYLVGGCVRDIYLRRRPKDFDVATSATPQAIKKKFRNSRIIGRRFKLAHVFFGRKIIETSTFRTAPTEGSGDDPLITHDNEWGSVEDDARRRDFTINGLFYDVEAQSIIDFVDGLSDLDAAVVRTIGDPVVRFQEDPVRMIRAVKFAARLEFEIEPATWAALLEVAPDIVKSSRARLLEEIYKLLRSGASHGCFALLLKSGLLPYIMPSWSRLFDEVNDGVDALLAGLESPNADTPAATFWRLLAALDDYVVETADEVTNGLMQAVLFAPLVPGLTVEARQGVDKAIENIMTPVGAAMGIARRDRELARQILMAHRRLFEARRGKRRRTSLAQRQYFHDALAFVGIWVGARPEDGSELEAWKQITNSRLTATAPEAETGRPRRRRRRGGRKRNKQAEGGDAASSKSKPAADPPPHDA